MAARPSWFDNLPSLSDDPAHPTQIALRTYALALALSLGPPLIPFVTAQLAGKKSARTNLSALKHVLRRELGHDGFAFAITLSIGGGAALRHLWDNLRPLNASASLDSRYPPPGSVSEDKLPNSFTSASFRSRWFKGVELSLEQRTFVTNLLASSVGILLLQEGRQRASRLARINSGRKTTQVAGQISPTLDLTLLLFVRALDSLVQTFIHRQSGHDSSGEKVKHHHHHHPVAEPRLVKDLLEKEQRRRKNILREKLTSRLDSLLFWICSTRIMWCFFYEPQRLPRSYVKWINTLANVDSRLLLALKLIREGGWGYINCPPAGVNLLKGYATELGRPVSWGDPTVLPAYGGASANVVWKALGVMSRPGVGGLPCEIVHGDVGASLGLSHSCLANTGLRAFKAFMEAIAIYIPAHFLPVLMTRPRTLFRPHRFSETFVGALRSAAFLSTFVASYWLSICLTRSLVLAKLLPSISHDFWDGPFGCTLAGSLVCGSSIWIENGKRRGEMALYVMPKALRACLPDSWVKVRNRRVRIAERIIIIISISTLLTAAVHRPESLRGLSRWTLSFIINGPNAGFWKRKRRDPSIPPTPSFPPTPTNPSFNQTPGWSRSDTPNPMKRSNNLTAGS